jgi:hypothetical protein
MRTFARRTLRGFVLPATALAVAVLGLSSTGAGAAPATTTTLPAAIVRAGNAYAQRLLDAQPIPSEARQFTTLPTPIQASGGLFPGPDVRHAQHDYLLPMSVSVDQYVRAHLPSGEKVEGTGSSGGPNVNPVYSMSVSFTCVSPHVAYCGITYATTEAKDGQQELAVGVQVIYLPILHVKMPTDGVVTVTGYGKTSLMDRSSDPTSVVLSRHQALALRTAISGLKDLGSNGMCMEDSLLLNIKIVRDAKVVWRATADACPGRLTIASATTNAILDNRNCAFWHVVASFFPSGAAKATVSEAKYCDASQFG